MILRECGRSRDCTRVRACCLPQRQGVVRAVGLTVPHQVAALFTEREQRLCLWARQWSVVPSERHKWRHTQTNWVKAVPDDIVLTCTSACLFLQSCIRNVIRPFSCNHEHACKNARRDNYFWINLKGTWIHMLHIKKEWLVWAFLQCRKLWAEACTQNFMGARKIIY